MTLERITSQPEPYQPFLLSQGIRSGTYSSYRDKPVMPAMTASWKLAFALKASRHFRTSRECSWSVAHALFFLDAMNFLEIDQLPTALQAVVTHQHLSSGHILFHRNEAARAIYVVISGRIRLLHYTQEGQSISHYTVHAGEVCAEIVLFLDVYTCSAIAEEPTQVLVFPKQVFLNTLQQNPDFATAFMAQMSYRLHVTKEMVVLRSIRSAPERILHFLRLTIPPEQNTVVLEQLFKNIACELGISPEVFSRTLTRLERDGVIAREKRKITLLA